MINSVRKMSILTLPFLFKKEIQRTVEASEQPASRPARETLLDSYARLLNVQTDLLIRQIVD